MAVTTITKQGITTVDALAISLIADLATILTLKFPISLVAGTTKEATFESSTTVDPLFATQPWRLRIESDGSEHLQIQAGTIIQLPNDGGNSLLDDGETISGDLGNHSSTSPSSNVHFFNRSAYQLDQKQAYPINYSLSYTKHGLSLFIWETSMHDSGTNYSWFIIQRPVDNSTGATLVAGKCPVFCMYAINRAAGSGSGDSSLAAVSDVINKFTVREADVNRPALSYDATIDTDDGFRCINKKQQVAITEDSKYVLTFPNGLTTQRYAYPNYELDMLAYSSADVLSESSVASITVYGEASVRGYTAMSANKPRNTGMRVFQLTSGTDAKL